MMERNFYTDNFEKLLKENADQFKMYPSRNVWHGLYNDLHPGRRWPSITMSILFLFSLVIIGHLNTSNNHRQHFANNLQLVKQPSGVSRSNSHHEVVPGYDPSDISIPAISELSETTNPVQQNIDLVNSIRAIEPEQNPKPESTNFADPVTGFSKSSNNINSEAGAPAKNDLNKLTSGSNHSVNHNNEISSAINNNPSLQAGINTSKNKDGAGDEEKIIQNNDITTNLNTLSNNNQQDQSKKTKATGTKNPDTKLVESSALASSSSILPRIKKENISWTYYISPSVSYRNVINPPVNNTVALNGPVFASNSANDPVQSPSLGLESGVGVNYKLFKKIQFVTGIQLNYSRYIVRANHTHPTMTSLYLNSETDGTPYALTAISIYGNGTSTGQSAEVALHNYSFQVSLPVGIQYELFGNDKIRLNAMATFQPSFTIANQSYILSTDKRNYITDRDLMRTWNLNTNIGTYLSFKTNTLNWQIGPQIRYQILSTFTSNYPSKEHLIDYGVRFGVSKLIH